MTRRIALMLAVALMTSTFSQVFAVSQANAQGKPCTYTSQDKKNGYRC